MVTQTYLLHEPPPPSVRQVFVHQRVVPFLINLVGAAESRLETLAVWTRAQPAAAVATSFAIGCVMATVTPRRRG